MENNDLKYILARRVDIIYRINSKRYARVYPAEDKDVKDLLVLIACIAVEYEINNWKVNFSDSFFIEKEYIYSIDQIKDDLSNNINTIKSMNKAMKLTK